MSMWTSVFTLLIILAVWRIKKGSTTKSTSLLASIPKVRGYLPGNLDLLWKIIRNESREYCGDTFRQWAEEYGPTYDLNLLWGSQIITVDPSNVKHILANDFDSFGKGAKFQAMLEPFLGSGIFTTDGEIWKQHRATARPFFSAERVTDFDCFERHTSNAMNILSKHAETGEAFDIQSLYEISIMYYHKTPDSVFQRLSRFTLDVGMEFLFGQDCSVSTREYEAFSEAFNDVSKIVTRRVRIGSTWRYFELGRDPTEKPMCVIHTFVEPILERGLAQEPEKHLEERTFLDHLIQSNQDIKTIRDGLLNFLLASRDTTASLLSFVIYILALHPDVCRRLRHEVSQIMEGQSPPTLADLKQMKYLRAVINEVLRLFPPVPFNIRRCVKLAILPSVLSKSGPFSIVPGTSVTYSPLLIQRRVDFWGTSACEFDPDRWLREGPKAHVTHPFAFLPFNGGPRICLGQQFAYHECSYFIVRLLENFQGIELAEDAQALESCSPIYRSATTERQNLGKCWPRASLTLYISGGLWIRLKP